MDIACTFCGVAKPMTDCIIAGPNTYCSELCMNYGNLAVQPNDRGTLASEHYDLVLHDKKEGVLVLRILDPDDERFEGLELWGKHDYCPHFAIVYDGATFEFCRNAREGEY